MGVGIGASASSPRLVKGTIAAKTVDCEYGRAKRRIGSSFAEEVTDCISERNADEDEQLDRVALAGGKALQEDREQPVERDEHPSEKEGEAAYPQQFHCAVSATALRLFRHLSPLNKIPICKRN
ncbi:hypothetical protein [Ellagibacter isourolithinifaciens]|uniref:hypothetical protein n=1 Tax=Ellagibacter isourolithinifaciens TaxID=2137581 RepID=UPI002E7A3D46|nr:hypothetical protein [Ellagibacter isourolithinifaciens]MEE0246751.1 hypothetical protein [Ellagibacter isourolithinifaciens]